MPMETPIDWRERVLPIGMYLLDSRALSPSDERFLLSIVERARQPRPLRFSGAQAMWFESIIDRYQVDECGDHLLGVCFASEVSAC